MIEHPRPSHGVGVRREVKPQICNPVEKQGKKNPGGFGDLLLPTEQDFCLSPNPASRHESAQRISTEHNPYQTPQSMSVQIEKNSNPGWKTNAMRIIGGTFSLPLGIFCVTVVSSIAYNALIAFKAPESFLASAAGKNALAAMPFAVVSGVLSYLGIRSALKLLHD